MRRKKRWWIGVEILTYHHRFQPSLFVLDFVDDECDG